MRTNTIKRLFILSISFIFIFNCKNNSAPKFEEEISVYVVLEKGLEQHFIFVYRTFEDVEQLIEAEELFIKNGEVEIRNSDSVYKFDYYIDSTNYYTPSRYTNISEKFVIESGETYSLKIETDIGTLKGETTVPNPIRLLTPYPNTYTTDRTPLEIIWEKDDTAFGYVINLKGPPYNFSWQGKTTVRRDIHIFNTVNQSIIIPGELIRYDEQHWNGEFIEDERRYTLILMGFDENFKHHEFDGYPVAGIENGYGVFGSVVVDSLNIFVRK